MSTSRNELFPVFLKVHELNVLLVGGGNVALEKLTFLFKSSPQANVTLVADRILPEVRAIAKKHASLRLFERRFGWNDLHGKQLAILATDDRPLHEQIREYTRGTSLLLNVADTPELCDLYLGGIVTKGDLKIAISTNGRSPTLAKRIRQYLEEALPEETQALIDQLDRYRKTLKGDFAEKVRALNRATASLIDSSERD